MSVLRAVLSHQRSDVLRSNGFRDHNCCDRRLRGRSLSDDGSSLMSWHDYRESLEMAVRDYSFYGMIMAAIRRSDTDDLELLKAAWPKVWKELQRRYKVPGGFLTKREMEKFG